MEHFKKAVELNPRSGDAKIGLGSAYHQKGDSEKALEVLKTGLLLCPESAQIHFEMGKVYQSLGNKDEAMNHYKESAECAIRLQKKRN